MKTLAICLYSCIFVILLILTLNFVLTKDTEQIYQNPQYNFDGTIAYKAAYYMSEYHNTHTPVYYIIVTTEDLGNQVVEIPEHYWLQLDTGDSFKYLYPYNNE